MDDLDKNLQRARVQYAIQERRTRSADRFYDPVVGFTSGAFDLLHEGHVEFLAKCKEQCDILVVAVNSDTSVQMSKGPLRPIQNQDTRRAVVQALGSVDHVFVFDEKGNTENIHKLRPEIYFKGGDYKKEQLGSASWVEHYGGRVEIVPTIDKATNSTSSIVQKVLRSHGFRWFDHPHAPAKTLFLDRDGTLIKHVPYLHEPSKVEILPGVVEGLKLFRNEGFRFVMVTNQPGIGLGFYSKEAFFETTLEVFKQLSPHGILFDKVYFSPYSKSDGTNCRKPGIGLLEDAEKELCVLKHDSIFIGDQDCDIQCGKNYGCLTAYVGPEHPSDADFEGSTIHDIFGQWLSFKRTPRC